MRMLCQNPNCDFEFEDNPANASLFACPKCGGGHFANVKPAPGLTADCSAFAFGMEIVQRFNVKTGSCGQAFAAGCAPPFLVETIEVKL